MKIGGSREIGEQVKQGDDSTLGGREAEGGEHGYRWINKRLYWT